MIEETITSGSGGAVWKRKHRWYLAGRPTSPIAALLAGYTTNKHIVDESSTRTAIAENAATD